MPTTPLRLRRTAQGYEGYGPWRGIIWRYEHASDRPWPDWSMLGEHCECGAPFPDVMEGACPDCQTPYWQMIAEHCLRCQRPIHFDEDRYFNGDVNETLCLDCVIERSGQR